MPGINMLQWCSYMVVAAAWAVLFMSLLRALKSCKLWQKKSKQSIYAHIKLEQLPPVYLLLNIEDEEALLRTLPYVAKFTYPPTRIEIIVLLNIGKVGEETQRNIQRDYDQFTIMPFNPDVAMSFPSIMQELAPPPSALVMEINDLCIAAPDFVENLVGPFLDPAVDICIPHKFPFFQHAGFTQQFFLYLDQQRQNQAAGFGDVEAALLAHSAVYMIRGSAFQELVSQIETEYSLKDRVLKQCKTMFRKMEFMGSHAYLGECLQDYAGWRKALAAGKRQGASLPKVSGLLRTMHVPFSVIRTWIYLIAFLWSTIVFNGWISFLGVLPLLLNLFGMGHEMVILKSVQRQSKEASWKGPTTEMAPFYFLVPFMEIMGAVQSLWPWRKERPKPNAQALSLPPHMRDPFDD